MTKKNIYIIEKDMKYCLAVRGVPGRDVVLNLVLLLEICKFCGSNNK